MQTLSWTEIRQRAIQFSRDWSGETEERAEAQTFWNELFQVFGMKRRQVASFESRVKSIRGQHRIDLFWKGKLLAEHKSRGEDLSKASSQAFNYIQELINEGRSDECPRYVAISDFETIVLYDLEPENQLEIPIAAIGDNMEVVQFPVSEFHQHIKHFAFIPGLKTQRLKEQDPANLKAVDLMANLHDALAEGGYDQPELERMLVRLLFCLFADDTGIFDPDSFELFIENRTREDGYDLGMQLQRLFEVMDTPNDKRTRIHDEELLAFPYVNGQLFSEQLHFAAFNKNMRDALLKACRFEWSRISPAIFGSLFQGVMDSAERRKVGAHYTSERDILKLIGPLFLDDLKAEFHQIVADRSTRFRARLQAFQTKLASLNFLDPACGCGNFLVIAYRELRRIELEVLKLLHGTREGERRTQGEMELGENINKLSIVDVNQFYGIEIDMWPSRIAETALWLTDHQMNRELSEAFGQLYLRIPLKSSPHIICENALRIDWNDVIDVDSCNFVLGNPPFVGAKEKSASQRVDIDRVWAGLGTRGKLDYVSAWYKKAADYINDKIRGAFVSTNSITMGEQVGILWSELLKMGLKIHFAHRTFSWQSEARGAAQVHCIIVGWGKSSVSTYKLYEYTDVKGDARLAVVSRINPYLIEGSDDLVLSRTSPLCSMAPKMMKGTEATDNGHMLLTDEERTEFIEKYPDLEPLLRPFLGGKEYINDIPRWCFWLMGISPATYRDNPEIKARIQAVKEFRENSPKVRTREIARTPAIFGEIRQPVGEYLLIPKVSSERRDYIPIGFVSDYIIASGSALIVPNPTLLDFGVITSTMHMAWMRLVGGRTKSDYQYSVKIVYNNFPWPDRIPPTNKARIESLVRQLLDVRKKYLKAGNNLADIYDPLYMPPELNEIHRKLDREVDRLYRSGAFQSEKERVEFLFEKYRELVSPIGV